MYNIYTNYKITSVISIIKIDVLIIKFYELKLYVLIIIIKCVISKVH